MAKNALQTALDLVKSGALRTMAASPIGQFASKVGQATSFLRAPSMEDLGNAYNQSVGRASSFVQKYPSPASYVAQRIPQVPQVQLPQVRQYIPEVKFPETRMIPLLKTYAPQVYEPLATFGKNLLETPKIAIEKYKIGNQQSRAALAVTGKNLLEDVADGIPWYGIPGRTIRLKPPEISPIFSIAPPIALLRSLREGATSGAAEKMAGDLDKYATTIQEDIKKEMKKYEHIDNRPIQEKVVDPRYWIGGFAQTLPNMLGAMVAGGAGTIAGGPVGGLAAGFAYTSSLEGGSAYMEAKQEGASEEQADSVAKITGTINGALEMIPLWKYMKNLGSGKIFQQKMFSQIIKGLVSKQSTLQAIEEGSTEMLQQLVSNSAKRVYNEMAPIFNQEVIESGLLGLFVGKVFGTALGGGDVTPQIGLTTEAASGSQPPPPPGPTGARVGKPTGITETFGKIADVISQKSGVGFHSFEGPDIRTILKMVGLSRIPEGTVETPNFIVQYRKKDYAGNPITPVLTVNLFQEAQPSAQPVTPQVVPQPPVQPITPVPQVPKATTPIQSPPSSTKRILGRSANVSEGIHESMSTVTTADEALQKLNIYVGEFSKTADKRQLADLRAGLVKEITNLTGGSGDYKKDYAMRVALRNDTEIGELVRQLEDHISAIDNGTIKSSPLPSIGGEIPKGGETPPLPTAPVSDEIPSPAFLDHVREMARTVNVDEMDKLNGMSIADANKYATQQIAATQGPMFVGITSSQQTSPTTAKILKEGTDLFNAGKIDEGLGKLQEITEITLPEIQSLLTSDGATNIVNLSTKTHGLYFNIPEASFMLQVSSQNPTITLGSLAQFAQHHTQDSFITAMKSTDPTATPGVVLDFKKSLTNQEILAIEKIFNDNGIGLTLNQQTGSGYALNIKEFDSLDPKQFVKILKDIRSQLTQQGFNAESHLDNYATKVYKSDTYDGLIKSANQARTLAGRVDSGIQSGIAATGQVEPQLGAQRGGDVGPLLSEEPPATTQQVTPPVLQESSIQPALAAPIVPSAPISQVPTTPPLKETAEKKVYGFTKNVLKYDTATEEFKQKILGEIKDHYYKVLHNKDVVDEAQQMIAGNKDETLKRVLNVNDLDTVLNAAGEILEYQAQHEGDLVLSDKIHKVLMEKFLRSGQQGQIARIWAGMTPEGRLHFADSMIREAVDKMSKLDKLANRTSMMEEAPKVAQKLGEELNKANLETLDTVLEDVKQKAKNIKRKTTEQGTEISSEELLGERVIRYVKSLLTSPTKEQDPVKVMVDTLYKVALEILPKKTPVKKDPLQFIAEAIKDKEGYGEAWNLARDIVEEKFADKPEALAHLDDYFAHILDRPFAQTQLNQAVATRLKEGKIDITTVVRDYYVEKQKLTGETLATRLSQEAGLTDEDARMLEDYVTKRFAELTKTKKEQILASMMKETPQLAKHKTLIQKIIEASNLGAFNDRKYYDMLAKRFNIPNISEELAHQIYTMTQNIQTLVPGTERDKQVQSVMNLVSDQLPLDMVDIWDAYRKNNMLSGPGSNMRNAYSNALVTSILVPFNLLHMAIGDAVYSTLRGKERQFYASMVPAYIKSSIGAIPLAVDRFKAAWRGEMPIDDPTLKELNYLRIRRAFPKLSIPTRFLEAADQLFQTVISEGVSAALQSNGMAKEQADEYGLRIAKQELFKSPLDPENKTDQGGLMASIDKFTTGLLQMRTGVKPLDWVLPFVVVPALWAKQAIRYTAPLGTLVQSQIKDPVMKGYQGGATKTGLTFLFLSAAFAIKGLSEWEGEKKDETLRTAGYDSGKRDYSIKIGNAWVPLWFFGPLFFSMALPIAIRHYWIASRTAKTDGDIKKIARVGLGLAKAFTSATFLRGIGDFFKILNGELDSSWSQYAANLASQNIYYSGLLRWMSMLVDDTYRKSNTFYDAIKKGIPFWSQTLEPYYTLKGEPSKRNASAALTPYPIGIENPEAYYIFTERNHTLQNYNVINQAIKEIDLPSNIKKDSEEGLTYMEAHPETEYISILTTLKNKLSDLSSDRLKTYVDKQMSTEEKNALLSDIDAQQEDVLKQATETINEVRKIQKKPENNRIFDEVEAASYAEDFKTLMPGVESVRKDALATSQTEFEQIRLLADQKEKYKKIRERFDFYDKLKKDNFTKGREAAVKVGIDPAIAEYDWWSAQELYKRDIHVRSQINGLTGQEAWNVLVSFRMESPGTGNMVLNDQLISDLVDEGYLSKSQGTQLRKIKIKTNTRGEQLMRIGSGGGGGSRLSELKHISTLMEQRGQAYQKALKIKSPRGIPKISFPKAPKIPKIKLTSMTVAPSKFKLRIPKRTSIKTSGRMQSLIRVRK